MQPDKLTRLACFFLSLGFVPAAGAQQVVPDKKWSVEEIHGPPIQLRFTTDEGTWMSVDVSPDGKTLIFDLLGDLYTLPISGGKATRFTSGTKWDATPRYSPDGKLVLFASDPTGSDQLWTIPVDGGTPTRITEEGPNLYLQPSWDPSGNFLFAVRQSTPFSPNEFVMLHVGGGKGTVVAEPGATGVVASADGRWIYYATTISAFGSEAGRIVRIDRRTGQKSTIVSGYQQLRRPQVSGNGRWLAFAATLDAKPRLVVRDLETGHDRVLYTGLDRTPIWGNNDLDALPGYAFTPDNGSIIFTADGKIRRVSLTSGQTTVIPFIAEVDLTATGKVMAKHRLPDGPFRPKVLLWAQRLDAGRLLVYAAGKLFAYEVASRRATPFAPGPGLQFAPAVSPDAAWVVYLDWTDAGGGRLMKVPAAGGRATPLAVRSGRYQSIAWSPDGTKLVLAEQRLEPDGIVEQGYEIHWLDLARPDRLHHVASVAPRGNWRKPGQRPTFDASGERIYFVEPSSEPMIVGGASMGPSGIELCSVALNGGDRRCAARFRAADEVIPSPDGKWVAFTEMHNVYLAPLPPSGREPVELAPGGGAFPVYLLSPQGDYIYWREAGRKLLWGWGPVIYEIDLASAATGRKVTPAETTVSFELPRAQARGELLLKNARIVTMKSGTEVLERGDLLVSNGRVAAVGPAGRVEAPAGVNTMDLTGKTIIPGFIDLHAHYILGASQWQGDLHTEQDPHLLANLAYGVTTWRDPSIRSQTLFALGEMVEAGTTLGPRIHGTGDIFIPYELHCCGLPKDFDDARRIVRNQKALGATSIKEHTVPRRDQVQWIIQASREESLQVVSDPARGPRKEIRPLLDGMTSLEHAYAALPIKKDVIEVFARTGAYYVPTLMASPIEPYFMTMMNPHEDAKLRRFVPHARLDQEIHLHNRWFMPHEVPTWYAESLRDIVRGGGKVGMGSHGQLQGLGSHWEVWAMGASGGLTPLEAIRSATFWAAEAMGMEDDIGSLEPGKLADLMVLDRNPLEDIKNTNSIRYVMKAGTLWNGDTMDELWPTKRTRSRGTWEDGR